MKNYSLTITFNPEDLSNSDIWWIKGYWSKITKLWKKIKGTELKQLDEYNMQDFLELNMKTILFTVGELL